MRMDDLPISTIADSHQHADDGIGLVADFVFRVGYLVVGILAMLFVFLLMRKFAFYLTWRSFRDGPYVLGVHQWRPGKLAG